MKEKKDYDFIINMGWIFLDYLYTPKRTPKFNTWGFFFDNFLKISKNVQELTIKKITRGKQNVVHITKNTNN
jgi:hypothetical protein